MGRIIPPKPLLPKVFNIKEYNDIKNKILIYRQFGGLGDILMQRMLFEDMKIQMPEAEIHYACPENYIDAAKDHPFIDKVIDYKKVKIQDYIAFYDISRACAIHETAIAPKSDIHRSDIWARHCGIKLKNHNMHIRLSDEEKKYGKNIITSLFNNTKPTVAFCPISAMINKTLMPLQVEITVKFINNMGCNVFIAHNKDLPEYKFCPVVYGQNIRQWMATLGESDYIVSVDTAGFHFGGGYKKPTLGLYTYCDGKVYGRYYDCITIQKHRDDGNWDCGPCYNYTKCSRTTDHLKPCLTTFSVEMIETGLKEMFKKWPQKT